MKKEYVIDASLNNNFEIQSDIRGHKIISDQPRKDFEGKGPTPLEYLLFSLASCYITLIKIIGKQNNLPINNINIKASGIIDNDKLLGKQTEQRAGFEAIKIKISFDENISKEMSIQILNEIKLRCPVSENLINNTPIYIE